MPREQRKKSSINTYYIEIKENNVLFKERSDYEFFQSIIKTTNSDLDFDLYAYCLLDDSIHLLLYTGHYQLSSIIKRLLIRYTAYYNKKYCVTGSLFTKRFVSTPIEADWNLNKFIAYTHQFPIKMNLCNSPMLYQYSSAHEYYFKMKNLCKISIITESDQYDSFIASHSKIIEKAELVPQKLQSHFTDTDVSNYICSLCHINNPRILLDMPKTIQQRLIIILLNQHIPAGQIKRVSGLNPSIIADSDNNAYVHVRRYKL